MALGERLAADELELVERFSQDGFVLLSDLLSDAECQDIADDLPSLASGSGGSRCLLSNTAALAMRLREYAASAGLIPTDAVAVQCTYFEKTALRNWLVPIHQDLSIPVAERCSDPALRGWSEKGGEWFVQPPVGVLEQLVAIRLHLDDCFEEDGPLRVLAGSHRLGRIAAEDAVSLRKNTTEVVCCAERGAALVMRPLLLHASSKATGISRRRVLHFLFGPRRLPYGLRWRQVVPA